MGDHVQELHIAVGHMLCRLVEEALGRESWMACCSWEPDSGKTLSTASCSSDWVT
jgi:hypothetical protein